MYPVPWELMAVPPLPPLPPRPVAPTGATLPDSGEHEVDPDRSTVTLVIRGLRRWERLVGTVSGRLLANRAAGHLALDMTGAVPGPRRGPRPPCAVAVRLVGADLGASDGAWVVSGSAEFDGVRVPLELRLGAADRRLDGSTQLAAAGTVDGRRAGLALPWGVRRVRVEIALTMRVAAGNVLQARR